MWIDGPEDWAGQTVSGKRYDPASPVGRRIWRACLDRAALLNQALDIGLPTSTRQPGALPQLFQTDPAERYGSERTVRPRLGQRTFRYALEQVYGQCAVSREHSLPALDAAHIVPYGDGGEHALGNGLLLRADIHRLYDAGYVTVTPDYEFKVSPRLREDYANGKVYYDLEHQLTGRTIWTPDDPTLKPDPERLDQHARSRFRVA
jgi:putative restriction endonuclease